jgi:hypothetical protein
MEHELQDSADGSGVTCLCGRHYATRKAGNRHIRSAIDVGPVAEMPVQPMAELAAQPVAEAPPQPMASIDIDAVAWKLVKPEGGYEKGAPRTYAAIMPGTEEPIATALRVRTEEGDRWEVKMADGRKSEPVRFRNHALQALMAQ